MSQMREYLTDCKDCNVNQETRTTLCPICTTQRVMKGKWKITIIWLLKANKLRFSELRKSIPNVTQTYLSKQLKSLEEDRLIVRKSYNQVPPKVEYSLTQMGREFIKVLDIMNVWGTGYLQEFIFPAYQNMSSSNE